MNKKEKKLMEKAIKESGDIIQKQIDKFDEEIMVLQGCKMVLMGEKALLPIKVLRRLEENE